MPAWEDSRITEAVKSELDDLQKVMAIISQCNKPVATRILQYCFNYIKDGQDVPPSAIPTFEEIKKMFYGALKNKEAA